MSVYFKVDHKQIQVGHDMRVEVDLGDGRLATVILTHEDIITDIYQDGELVATSSETYDEMAGTY
jgi:hypothetical protein